jgi:hypothetical protein
VSLLDLLALQRIYHNGVELFRRRSLNFTGGTVTDDPTNDRTNIALGGGARAVNGPEASTVGHVATFNGGDGTELSDGGVALADLASRAYVDTTTGWRTAFDVDFSALPNQTVTANGAVSIGGVTWTAAAFAKSGLFAVANGNGLRIKSNASQSGWYVNSAGNDPQTSMPHLGVALASAIPGFHLGMQVRVQCVFQSVGAANADEFAAVGLDSATWGGGDASKALRSLDGYLGASSARVHRWDQYNDNGASVESINTLPVTDSHRVLTVRDLVAGIGNYQSGGYIFASPVVFPSKSTLSGRLSFNLSAKQATSGLAMAAARRWVAASDIWLRLGAYNSNTANNTTFEGNFKRIKLEYRE